MDSSFVFPLFGKFFGALVIFTVLASFLWEWDRKILDAIAKILAADIDKTKPDGAYAEQATKGLLSSIVGSDVSILSLASQTLMQTLVSLVVIFVFYLMITEGFAAQLWDDGVARSLLLQQFWSSALLIVLVVNYLSLSLLSLFRDSIVKSSPFQCLMCIILDLVFKFIIFVILTATVYVLFAWLRGSFGGDPDAAIASLPDTIQYALGFRNLSGVYVYSILVSGFPLFIILLMKLGVTSRLFAHLWSRVARLLPIENKPIRFLGIMLAVFAASCGLICSFAVEAIAG